MTAGGALLPSVDMLLALLLSLGAVVYNNTVNWWPTFQGAAYVPINLVFGSATAIAATAAYGLSADELGVAGDLGDVAFSLTVLGVFALGAFTFARSRWGNAIVDARVQRQRPSLGLYVFIRIPLGTAFAEELIFRGALFAAWRAAGAPDGLAALGTAFAFGLWHIAPTIIGIRMNDPSATPLKIRLGVLAGVLLTTIAGLGLVWLRVWTEGLVAPLLVHAGVNSIGALASLRALHPYGTNL